MFIPFLRIKSQMGQTTNQSNRAIKQIRKKQIFQVATRKAFLITDRLIFAQLKLGNTS